MSFTVICPTCLAANQTSNVLPIWQEIRNATAKEGKFCYYDTTGTFHDSTDPSNTYIGTPYVCSNMHFWLASEIDPNV